MFAKTVKIVSGLAALQLLGACTTMPNGPNVMALPGTGKSFDQFRMDDGDCRQFASAQIGGTTAADAANESGVRTAALGTLLGAAAGAAANGSSGAGAGAGIGLAMGGLVGASNAGYAGYDVQRRYDYGYLQCMYAKGHRVPVSGYFNGNHHAAYTSRPTTMVPPPPPGTPPPPPPQ
ncbi:hypothetical protein EGT07_01510 [Herbaspirillum sp. HC18]|nr:hypothetical protein EGT07_01510 [Herbaspirillum sp. HC18]